MSSEKKSSVTFSKSMEGSGRVSSTQLLLAAHTNKTCPSMPCPPTPGEVTKLDLAMPTSHFLDVCHVTREGGAEESCECGSEQDDERAEKTTPTSVTWAGPLRVGVRNPTYTPSSPNFTGEPQDAAELGFADSAYVRSRYEWSEPDSLVESSSTDGGQYPGERDNKYKGDYERDPLYMSSRQQRRTPTYVNQSHTCTNTPSSSAHQQQQPAHPRADKYRGDYERSDTYIFPPNTPIASASPSITTPTNADFPSTLSSPVDNSDGSLQAGIGSGKYRGNYERSNLYVQNLLKTEIPSAKNSRSHTEHVQLFPSNSS